jgi:hypothetical protein
MPEFKLASEIQLPISETPNTADPEMNRLLRPIHESINLLAGMIDGRVLQSGLNAATDFKATLRSTLLNRFTVLAGEAISAGDPVYFVLSGGLLKAFRALATSTVTWAQGYCSQPGGVANGAYGEFAPIGGLNTLASPGAGSLTVGGIYYLQNGGGYGVNYGNCPQRLGVAISPTTILFGAAAQLDAQVGVWFPNSQTLNVAVTELAQATWHRIGWLVVATCYINIVNNTGANLFAADIGGLPFSQSGAFYGGAFFHYNMANYGPLVNCYVEAAQNKIKTSWNTAVGPGGTFQTMITAVYQLKP